MLKREGCGLWKGLYKCTWIIDKTEHHGVMECGLRDVILECIGQRKGLLGLKGILR